MTERCPIPLQIDMFTGQTVDARSSHQKRLDREREQPNQGLLFPIAEVFQIGVSVRPWLKALPAPLLVLEYVDLRTPEEIEREREEALRREAEKLMVPMFADVSVAEEPRQVHEAAEQPERPFSQVHQPGYRHLTKTHLVPSRERQGSIYAGCLPFEHPL